MTAFNVTTSPNGQKETVINGKRYNVQTDRYGEEYVVVDGRRVNLKDPIFNNTYEQRIATAQIAQNAGSIPTNPSKIKAPMAPRALS